MRRASEKHPEDAGIQFHHCCGRCVAHDWSIPGQYDELSAQAMASLKFSLQVSQFPGFLGAYPCGHHPRHHPQWFHCPPTPSVHHTGQRVHILLMWDLTMLPRIDVNLGICSIRSQVLRLQGSAILSSCHYQSIATPNFNNVKC